MPRVFEYNLGVPAEDIERYRPGGYHPVYLNDSLKEGRYQILNKLGFGAFSTVWLARDLAEERNVSIKVVVPEKSAGDNNELKILKHLLNCRDGAGSENVLHMLDEFYVDGPNGRHLCIVFDVLGALVEDGEEDLEIVVRGGQVSPWGGGCLWWYGLLSMLHTFQSVTTDTENHADLFRASYPENMSPAAIVERFGEPTTGAVTRKDGQPLGVGIPEYQVLPIRYGKQDLLDLGVDCVQLIDFWECIMFLCFR
ncbi:hypothetical protein K440DRAFT_675784 [Wilcoxina mikolae CBS 423.85]|nr:hypothetical protein K440DRAFT_675784 [Wilcoxina mikolae CBS 423.85]